MEIVPYGGWLRCARIVSGNIEAIVTLDVGPRIIRLGTIGGRNELHEDPNEMGKIGGDEYRSYGGHRLWIAPEDKIRTYQPENESVNHREENGWFVFAPKPDRFGIQKEMRIKPVGDGGFHLEHRITNHGKDAIHMSPWTLTVVTTGGTCLVPLEDFRPFPEQLTPARPLVLWSYTDLTDPRLIFGRRLVHLSQDKRYGPTKLGMGVKQGYVGYYNPPNLFIKRFSHYENQTYPDFGCNFETFTRQDMLEVEALGPLRDLKAGETATHYEAWKLIANVELSEEENALAASLEAYARDCTVPQGL